MTIKYAQLEDVKKSLDKVESLMIRQQVVVKSQVDEKFKSSKREELEKNLVSAKDGHRQLTEHLEKLHGENSAGARKQLEEHLQRVVGQIAVMQYQLQTLSDLKPGDYFTEMALEGFVTLKKGDNLKTKLSGLEVVIKNDIVQEIKIRPMDETKKS